MEKESGTKMTTPERLSIETDLDTTRLLARLASETGRTKRAIVEVALRNYAGRTEPLDPLDPALGMRDRHLIDALLGALVSDLLRQLQVLEPEDQPAKSADEWRTHVVLLIMSIDEMRRRYGPDRLDEDAAKHAAIKAMQERAGDVEAVHRGFSYFFRTHPHPSQEKKEADTNA